MILRFNDITRTKQFLGSLSKTILFIALVFCAFASHGQKRVQLERANKLKGAKSPDGEEFQKLLGDVVLVQNQTTIYCDSAYLFKKRNFVEAFGKVRITEGDSTTITGRKLEYDGETKIAKLRNNVVFTKLATATLYTDYLDFDRVANMAYYINGGRLVDSINVLTSRKGYYNSTSNMASFKRNVHVKNPDYTMTSDSLQYNSRTKIIYFRTPTTVVSKDSSTFVYNSGEYDTKSKQSDLNLGAGESQEYKIESKNFALDDLRKIYKMRDDVVMTHKEENLIIYGQAADYYRTRGLSKVYTRAYVAKITEDNDTLFMTADTLVSIEHEDPAKKRLLAYHNVKIFKRDLQGVADSVEYRPGDSTIYMYNKPVLWSEGNQMTADSISMLIKNNAIDKIFMKVNAFVISRDTLSNYNQIKGRKMTAEFKNSDIHRVLVQGNGESIYFALEEQKKDSVVQATVTMGMNKIICSNITIRFKDGKVDNFSFYVKPEAKFIPPHEIVEEDKELKGFSWKEDQKPLREEVVHKVVERKKNAIPPQRKRL
ncbi:MAG TPA: OstA-like protein [Ohtaekwangia sp.]|nr:OstA-like protein [Ohtaekwangia sp.]